MYINHLILELLLKVHRSAVMIADDLKLRQLAIGG